MTNPLLLNCDCLEVMAILESESVDLVLADPPYGTTSCKWDSIIPLEPMWAELKRITKERAAVVLTASQPFTTTLISSNMEMFKYCWVWHKNLGSGVGAAKYRPMSYHEDIVVFGAGRILYNPQSQKRVSKESEKRIQTPVTSGADKSSHQKMRRITKQYGKLKGPETVLSIKGVPNAKGKFHPTQKPVALMEYLIKTYTNEGDMVLDFTMGSGTTGVACKRLDRSFIGIEKDEKYFQIAKERIDAA